jgi:hypothetical protein
VGNTKIVVQNRDKWLNIDQASSNNNARQKLGGGTGGSMNCSDSDAMKKGKFLNSNSNPRGPSSSSVWMGEFTKMWIQFQFVGGGQKHHPDNYVFLDKNPQFHLKTSSRNSHLQSVGSQNKKFQKKNESSNLKWSSQSFSVIT